MRDYPLITYENLILSLILIKLININKRENRDQETNLVFEKTKFYVVWLKIAYL